MTEIEESGVHALPGKLSGPLGPAILSAAAVTALGIGFWGNFPVSVSLAFATLIVTLTWTICQLSVRSFISWMPILYVELTLLSGILSAEFLTGFLNRPKLDASNWAWSYVLVIVAAVVSFKAIDRESNARQSRPEISSPEVSRLGIAGIGLLSIVGVQSIAQNLPSNYLIDPQAARQVVTLNVTPTQQIFYKLTIATILVLAYLGLRFYGRRRLLYFIAVGLIGAGALSIYGGRFLALSLIVGMALIWIRYSTNVKWRTLAICALVLYLVASTIAAYRYFSFYGQGIGVKEVAVTAASQTSIEFLDGLRYSTSYSPTEEIRLALINNLIDSVPDSIAARVGLPASSANSESVGALISRSFGQGDVGGIRIGAVGEVAGAFGSFGSVLLGSLLGFSSAWICRWERIGGIALVRAIVASVLLLSVVILGLVSFVSAFAVLGIYILLVEALRRRPGV